MNDYIKRIDNFIAPVAERGGFRLARVGGSVRDEILGRRVKDADYVAFGIDLMDLHDSLVGWALGEGGVSISPLKLRDGRQAGWRVFKKGYGLIEIALPRKEVSTGPGHRDFKIVLDPSLDPAEDAIRRDFTFNALYKWVVGGPRTSVAYGTGHAYGILTNVEDPTGRGLYDLQHKLVSTTYPDSFRDDPLRTLRALRFVSVLGYDLSTAAHNEMCEHASSVGGMNYKDNTSGTVLEEMSKLLMGDDVAKALRLMRDTGVMAHLFPELAPMLGFEQGSRYHDLTTDEHTFAALEAAVKAEASLRVRWALLFHDAGKPDVAWVGDDGRMHYYARGISEDHIDPVTGRLDLDHEEQGEWLWRRFCERANVPKDLREDVATLIRHHMVPLQPRNAGVKVRRMRVMFGDELLTDLLVHRACDCAGKQRSSKPQLQQVMALVNRQMEARDAGVPVSRGDLAITGRDIMELGVSGRDIGVIQAKILDEVVCQPTERRMSREWQMARAWELAK
jgi:tRNA nucleotidyltransferase (CCA-adding enzyme)